MYPLNTLGTRAPYAQTTNGRRLSSVLGSRKIGIGGVPSNFVREFGRMSGGARLFDPSSM